MASGTLFLSTVDESRKRKRSCPPWSELDEDLLRLVVERLFVEDRIHFRGVCKNWLACRIDDIPLIDHRIPWVMYHYFSPHHSICSVFDSSNRKLSYAMDDERCWDDERGWIIAGSLLSRAIPCASRCGWVLFSEKTRTVVNSSTLLHVYRYHVYNPLTQDIISLPSLASIPQDDHLGGIGIATFTSDPTSSDCLFAVPTISHTDQLQGNDRYYFISTYCIGDKGWKTHHDFPVHAMAYMRGNLYCFNLVQGLSSFHIATQEWRSVSNKPTLIFGLGTRAGDLYIGSWTFVAYGGHLHLVNLIESEKADQAPECYIFKYDWSDGIWRKMESLEGGLIFIGKPSFGVPAGKHTQMVANRVYYFSNNSHTSTPTPCFIVYGSSSSAGTKGDKFSKFSDQHDQIYYEPCPQKISSLGESRSWTWMDPPY